ncbi:hypothetical protein BS47DRAFT_1352633 [Hydnum rufescens UP504]|uniref:N-acetyltransferase domain-containing protein n=1 Tax=Hydnum rufescens UP504 TaxID=1448309 RepID=A0A9P6DL10_9AGAM|nr:hypothetical protein BS47DRAFT_1352633 [Hydnum rufescens UP504]
MDWSIREGTAEDAPAVSKICLSTGNAGKSPLAEPYFRLSSTFAYVLQVDVGKGGPERILGYICGAVDTRKYEEEAGEKWWPGLRDKYPVGGKGTERDIEVCRAFARPTLTPDAVVAAYPAHMHVNLLPEAQRKGWGRRLIDKAAEHIRRFGGRGVHLMIDPNNDEARQFYKRIGFVVIPEPSGECYGLDFERLGRVNSVLGS